MEFTKTNILSNIENILTKIETCDFLSFDFEFTGLHTAKTNYYDSIPMRYEHFRKHSTSYAATQLGISCFIKDENNEFKAYPMNFHLNSSSIRSHKKDFLMNSETIYFLNKNKFDYNKCFEKGIPFFSMADLADHKQYLLNQSNTLKNKIRSASNDSIDCPQLKEYVNLLEHFVKTDTEEIIIKKKFSSYQLFVFENLLWKLIDVNGKSIIVSKERGYDGCNLLKIKKTESPLEDLESQIDKNMARRLNNYEYQIKFLEIIETILKHKKPIIGHNCLLDFLHFYNAFIGDLHQRYEDFSKEIQQHFPIYYDTKYLAKECSSKEKLANCFSLQKLYEGLRGVNFNQAKIEICPKFEDESAFHSAHFDAYITGEAFVNMAFNNGSVDIQKFNPIQVFDNLKNRIFIHESDYEYLSFHTAIRTNNQSNLFHLRIPEEWQLFEVYEFIKDNMTEVNNAIELDSIIELKWVDSQNLMIKVDKKHLSKIILADEGDDSNNNRNPKSLNGPKLTKFSEYCKSESKNRVNIDEDGFILKTKKRKLGL